MGSNSSKSPSKSRKQLLQNTKIIDVVPQKQKLLRIDSRLLLPKTFQILVNHNIYSAPVVDVTKNEYLGFIDMVDIVESLVQIFDETELLGEDFDLFTLDVKEKRFAEQGTNSIVDLSKRNPLHILDKDTSLLKALELFQQTGVHRVCVGSGTKVENVLTESAIIDWLSHNSEQFSGLLEKTVGELSLGLKNVISIVETEKAIEAFKLMSKHRVTAVAVVDAEGKLKSTISAKDLRIVSSQHKILFARLYEPVKAFAAEAHKGVKDLDPKRPTLSCTKSSTLGQVVNTLSAFRRHRLFIIDDDEKPVGVISLGDVLEKLGTVQQSTNA